MIEHVEPIPIAEKLEPVFLGEAPVRGAFGGRGSTKTRGFALMAAIKGYQFARAGISGQIVCARELQKSLAESSMEEVKIAIRSVPWLNAYYEIGETYIRTICKRVFFTFAGLRHNVDSIKSMARILVMWVDEAENVRDSSWIKVIPTLREEGDEMGPGGEPWQAELWVTWNPESEYSATHKRFRVDPPDGAKIVEMNYTDNPWFPKVLNKQRLEDKRKRPDIYEHVWEGDFKQLAEGAFFGREMRDAKNNGRITSIPVEKFLPVHTFWDLGIDDDTAIWFIQALGKEVRVIATYGNSGFGFAHYADVLRRFQETYDIRWGKHMAPHDIEVRELSTAKRRIDIARQDYGIHFETVPRVQNKMDSIEALRELFPQLWFDKRRCGGEKVDGIQWADAIGALRNYHREFDENRQKYRQTPHHDWSSDQADAGQQMAMAWDQNRFASGSLRGQRPVPAAPTGGWQGA